MAKKASTATKNNNDILIKKYGAGAFISAEDFMSLDRVVIPVCPKLDMILDGGIPEGSFCIFSGPPKIGKTVTSLRFAANAQKLGRKIFYLNVEGRIKKRDFKGIKDLQLDDDKFEIVQSYRNEDGTTKILAAHEYLDIAEHKIENEPGCVIIIDSVSQLLTEKERDGELGEQHRAPGAVLLSQFTKRIANKLPVNNCIVIAIVHVVANTGGGMKQKSRTGGNKIIYAVDVDLECTYAQKWKIGGSKDNEESGVEIGKIIHWVTHSTAGDAGCGMKTTSYLRYGVGIDEVYELFDIAKLLELIELSGSWYKMVFLEGEPNIDESLLKSVQGEEKILEVLNSKPEILEILKKKIKETL